ncbi:MAG TPA: hypothetical protein VGD58_11095 [Herpetosiphonaceae bacterium]
MRSNSAADPLTCDHSMSYTALLPNDAATPASPIKESRQMRLPRFASAPTRAADDTGVEFLTLYRQLLSDIEGWCKPTGAPITQVIRRQALRDYVEVYCHTYPRQPSCPFPPRFGRYLAYLDGFEDIVEAIDGWCEWLNRQFLPGVVPIHLIRSALEEWDEPRRPTELPYTSAFNPVFGSLAAHEPF